MSMIRYGAMAVLLLVLLGTVKADSLPEGWSTGTEFHFTAMGAGHWATDRIVLDTTFSDASVEFSITSDWADILAVPAFSIDRRRTVRLRRGRGDVRWPGTPWIGGGVFAGEGQPFVAGLYGPLVEWGLVPPDSIRGFRLATGGFLGFEGAFSLALSGRDTLALSRVRSPWLGFAGFQYDRTALHPGAAESDDIVLNSLTIWGDLRYAEPWVVVAGAEGEQGTWAVEGELRDMDLIGTGWGPIEVVPGFRMAGNAFRPLGAAFFPGQRTFYLKAILSSDRYFSDAAVTAYYDTGSDSLSGVMARGAMISAAGLSISTEFGSTLEGDISAMGGLGTTVGNTSASLGIRHQGDSTRVTGTAVHCPRDDVAGELTVSGNIDGKVSPLCRMDLSAVLGPATGHVAVIWDDGVVTLTAGLRGFFR